MKFLVIGRNAPNGATFGVDEINAHMDYIDKLIAEGIVESFYGFVNGGGVDIYTANSGEELWGILHGSPLYNAFVYEIDALVDVKHIQEQANLATRD